MMSKTKILLVAGIFSVLVFVRCKNEKQEDVARYVNPFIGTGGSKETGHGNTFPGAAYPFGMVQLSPDNGKSGPLYCSGYSYNDSIIAGFSHTHLSGTGAGDLADISFMPTTKPIKEEYFTQPDTFVSRFIREHHIDLKEFYDTDDKDVAFKRNILLEYLSRFSHKREDAYPGYYYVNLTDDDIDAEFTVTEFTGFHRYTFNKRADKHNLILDLGFSVNRGKPVKTFIERTGEKSFAGYRFTNGWGGPKRVFFALEFRDAPESFRIFNAEKSDDNQSAEGQGVKAVFTFNGKTTRQVLMKVGISSGSIEGAFADLKTVEKYGFDFDRVKADTYKKWNDELSKVKVTSKDDNRKTIFYTALYHSYLAPYRFSDVLGEYKGYNNNVEKAEGYVQYTVLSLWDTFRALQPWLLIMKPELYNDIVKSMLAKYKQTGLLPYWEIMGNEGGSMIGYHAVPVIADAILKGVGDFDKELALKAMIDISNHDRKGLGLYLKYHYVPADKDQWGTVSETLEFSYDDWCIAQAAKALGKDDVYNEYMKRAQYYRNLFDPHYRLFRGKNSDGTWYEPFDPRFGEYGNPNYVEANAWQYSFFVPHDNRELIKLMGGKKGFEQMMDSLFEQPSVILGRWTEDIVGLIGQYAHGNEPVHHVAYLYDFIGKERKAQLRVSQIVDSLYTNAPDGLCGNDDCGQMSAWYVFSSLGFYPVNPLDGRYYLGAPQFDRTEIVLPSGKTFTVTASNLSEKNRFVKSKKLNGKTLDRPYITYDELIKGGVFEFEMGE